MCLESTEMWCWSRMGKINPTDCVRNEEVLHNVREEGSILHDMKKRKAYWIEHILHRNCLLNHVIGRRMERRIEVTGRRE
jgi:hypothetical protein